MALEEKGLIGVRDMEKRIVLLSWHERRLLKRKREEWQKIRKERIQLFVCLILYFSSWGKAEKNIN